jgi:two-component system, LytTR family, response regulator
MKKVVIIDDEPLARDIVKEYLATHKDFEVVAECANGFEGLKAIASHKPDLIFLDVQMPKLTGFEMLEVTELVPPVIFTTAFDEYAIKAFEANAVDYLLKPFSKSRFDAAIDKWQRQQQGSKNIESLSETPKEERLTRIVVREGREIAVLPVDDIIYIEAFDDYVKIFTASTFYLKKKTMGYYENALHPTQFFRSHRSFIFNLKHLNRIEPLEKNTYLAILKGGQKIPLSRQAYLKLKENIGL